MIGDKIQELMEIAGFKLSRRTIDEESDLLEYLEGIEACVEIYSKESIIVLVCRADGISHIWETNEENIHLIPEFFKEHS